MKTITTLAALAIAALMSIPAIAADLGKPEPLYATPADVVEPDVSGVYVSGHIGFANINRDAVGSIEGQKLRDNPEFVDLDEDGVDDIEPFRSPFEMVFTDLLGPAIATDEIDAMTYGGGLSYLHRFNNSRFGFELGADATFFDGAESSATFEGAPFVTSLSPSGERIYPAIGELQEYGQIGSASFERNYDVDVVLKGHYFLQDNVSVFVGGGPSWANATGAGGPSWANATGAGSHTSNYHPDLPPAMAAGVLDNSFEDDSTSLGYVLTAGVNWWVQPNVVFGIDGFYKDHSFDFESVKGSDASIHDKDYRFNVNDNLSVDDEIWGAKARLSIKLN